jgi:glycosyltransferase involved in cell wall biosynthesis
VKIIISSSFVPFVDGGGRFIVEWLERRLAEYGHSVERIYLPFVENPPQIIFEQMTAYRLIDLAESADRLIAIRPPAHMLRHPCKVLWFIHHLRAFYDLWQTSFCPISDTPAGRAIRDQVIAADNAALAEAHRVFTNSKTVAARLLRFNDIHSGVLYPPLAEPERFRCDGYGDEIVCVSRVERHKRQDLLVEALSYARTPVRLRLCGLSNEPAYADQLQTRIASDFADRVKFEHQWITEEEKVERLAGALAVVYVPVDEDSYGYPSLEASYARKPILTTSDSGGVLELVEDSVNGYVSEPDPRALAEAMDRLYTEKNRTAAMGAAAYQRVQDLGISWDNVIQKLLA